MWYLIWVVAVFCTVKFVSGRMAKLESSKNNLDD